MSNVIRNQPPNIPECDHSSEREWECLCGMQMTDPDHRCSRSHGNTPPPALPIPQPNFTQPNHPQVSIISHYLTIHTYANQRVQAEQFNMMSQFSVNGQAQQGRPRGHPRGRGRARARARGQAQPNHYGVINLVNDPVFHNVQKTYLSNSTFANFLSGLHLL